MSTLTQALPEIAQRFDEELQDAELVAICRRFRQEEAEQADSLIPRSPERSPLGERVTRVMQDIGCSEDVAVALLNALDRL